MNDITIALDAMGGDYGPEVVVPAAIQALKSHPRLKLILVGDERVIRDCLTTLHKQESTALTIHHASETVGMDELPSQALRTKKDSSMRIAINLVKEEKAQACVSAGNTGALMATARFVLKTLPGIDRPAIISELPNAHGTARVLDLGANIDSCAEHLFQFAVMGSVLTTAIDKITAPRVGLLNIGSEEIKGNDQVKRTAQLLNESKIINYIGYVEGDDIFKGTADIVVCDGFVGNVALKSSEGSARLIMNLIKGAFQQNLFTQFIGAIAKPILKSAIKRIDPNEYNGASLLGLQGIVIKSHGGATVSAYANAIHEAVLQVQQNVPRLIHNQVAELLQEGHLT